jgi:broad specificity phosphatase PhoE
MSEANVELWLVRHGETEWSLDGRHTSTTDIPLTEHGRKRAEELRDFLKGKTFAAVLVSPMQRARETCEIAGFGDVAVVDEGLKEWNYGESEGKTTAQMREKYGLRWSVWNSPIVGGESVEQVGGRADGVIARAVAAASPASQTHDPSTSSGQATGHPAVAAARDPTHDNKTVMNGPPLAREGKISRVALFAHAHILRILAARWIGLPPVDGRLLALGTGSVSVLGHERETRVIARWNRGFEAE